MIKRIISSVNISPGTPEIAEHIYMPDFSAEEKLFELSGMHNVIDIAMQKPALAAQIQSGLQLVNSSGYDTSEMSDSQLIDTCVDRQFDVNEVSEYVERDLKKFKDNKK